MIQTNFLQILYSLYNYVTIFGKPGAISVNLSKKSDCTPAIRKYVTKVCTEISHKQVFLLCIPVLICGKAVKPGIDFPSGHKTTKVLNVVVELYTLCRLFGDFRYDI